MVRSNFVHPFPKEAEQRHGIVRHAFAVRGANIGLRLTSLVGGKQFGWDKFDTFCVRGGEWYEIAFVKSGQLKALWGLGMSIMHIPFRVASLRICLHGFLIADLSPHDE
ncbi:MAG: hypothetical protein WCD52_11425 [Xanthobacteraceae bacterium]